MKKFITAAAFSAAVILSAAEKTLFKSDFKKDRDNIKNILKAMSSDKELDMHFTTYRFEEDGCNAVYTEGAQNNINSNIDECHAFILICDDNIGNKTVAEFEYALERCKKGKSRGSPRSYRC